MTPERPSKRRSDVLPYNLPPRGLSRDEAAAYVGISASLLDDMVEQGKLPRPIELGRRNVWDRWKIDEALTRLSVELEDAVEKLKVEFFGPLQEPASREEAVWHQPVD